MYFPSSVDGMSTYSTVRSMFVEVVDTRFEPYLVWVLQDYSRITAQFRRSLPIVGAARFFFVALATLAFEAALN